MVQVNLLLPLAGRMSDSFVMNDLMRLPLGILSGMGFIGAGAIVRRDNFVVGVTTAATMWFLTVVGLCFGGGQVILGGVGTALGLMVLSGMKLVEDRMKQDHQARLTIAVASSSPEESIRAILESHGFAIAAVSVATAAETTESTYELRWRAKPYAATVPEPIRALLTREGVIRAIWAPQPR
jgi:putative Mg2+ transporter-C (MgtC) family protein